MALNPVEQKLVYLCNQWVAFRADQARRLLVWQVPENAVRMVECFLEAQKHEGEYSSGDLFVTMKEPFGYGLQYARSLKESLRGQFDASIEAIRAEGLATDWAFDPATTSDSPAGFVQALASFGSKYHQSIGHLVAVLLPLSVASERAFVEWLTRLLDSGLPERMRILIVDSIEHPRFDALLAEVDPRILRQRPAVDTLQVAQETFAQEATVGPGGVFRNLLIGLMTLLEKGSADQVKAKAVDALAFARKQQWADQEVAVRVLVAGALMKESRHAEAIRAYEAARQAAELTVKAGHPAGLKLVLQTWFGQAGAHLAARDDAKAAAAYDDAALVAQRDRDPILTIEAFRMAGFCLARAGDAHGALERGQCAVRVGEVLKSEARAMTTLPVALVDMLRVIDRDRVTRMQSAKSDLLAQFEAARNHAESNGAAAGDAPNALATIDAELGRAQDEARAHAAARLDALVAEGTQPFRDVAAQAVSLLGDDWMTGNDIALPPLFVPPETPAGGPAA
ncbi:hypothetical protein BH11PSE8_BH11PSE8_34000 [soil metagenome]